MAASTSHAVTGLLLAWSRGEQTALEKLVPLVYAELRRIAHRYMNRERRGHTLQTTELVNEAYLRLIDANQVRWQDRAHFFAISAQLLVEDFHHARGRNHYVGRLQVAMSDAFVMGGLQCLGNLVSIVEGRLNGQRTY